MSILTKKVINGTLHFYYKGKRIDASKYYKLRVELSEKN